MNTHPHDRAKVVAHEMRSPLAAIHNALEVMRVGAADACIVEVMRGRIARQLRQLTRLVNDLLDEDDGTISTNGDGPGTGSVFLVQLPTAERESSSD